MEPNTATWIEALSAAATALVTVLLYVLALRQFKEIRIDRVEQWRPVIAFGIAWPRPEEPVVNLINHGAGPAIDVKTGLESPEGYVNLLGETNPSPSSIGTGQMKPVELKLERFDTWFDTARDGQDRRKVATITIRYRDVARRNWISEAELWFDRSLPGHRPVELLSKRVGAEILGPHSIL